MKPWNTDTDEEPSDARPVSTAGIALAMGCFALAFLLMGGACYVALGWDVSRKVQHIAVAVGTLAASMVFAGLGALSLARKGSRTKGRRSQHNFGNAALRKPDPVRQRLETLDLTDKELEVALLILQHHSYNDIAQISGITPRTVQFHASNVFHKAQVARRRDFERLLLEKTKATIEPSVSTAEGAASCSLAPGNATPPCNFPECAVCQRKDRMACVRPAQNPAASANPPQSARTYLSPRQPKGNGW